MLFTRCPDCETTFRITAEALRKADGQVQCGRCARVFNGYSALRRHTSRRAASAREERATRADPRVDAADPEMAADVGVGAGDQETAANPGVDTAAPSAGTAPETAPDPGIEAAAPETAGPGIDTAVAKAAANAGVDAAAPETSADLVVDAAAPGTAVAPGIDTAAPKAAADSGVDAAVPKAAADSGVDAAAPETAAGVEVSAPEPAPPAEAGEPQPPAASAPQSPAQGRRSARQKRNKGRRSRATSPPPTIEIQESSTIGDFSLDEVIAELEASAAPDSDAALADPAPRPGDDAPSVVDGGDVGAADRDSHLANRGSSVANREPPAGSDAITADRHPAAAHGDSSAADRRPLATGRDLSDPGAFAAALLVKNGLEPAPEESAPAPSRTLASSTSPGAASGPKWVILDEPRPRRAPPWLWRVGCVTAAVLLVLQALHHYRADIAVLGVVGPWVRQAYAALGSVIAPNWNLEQYEIEVDWDAAAEPSADGQRNLRIAARIRNEGPRALPLPHVQVQLKDRWESTIGSRVFAPAEYIPRGRSFDSMLEQGQSARAELDILDPGARAYGFELDVCVDAGDGTLRCAADEVFR